MLDTTGPGWIKAVDAPCDVCGDPPTQYSPVWPRKTPRNGEMNLCDRCSRIPTLRRPTGLVCGFDRHATAADAMLCADCREARRRDAERTQLCDTIDPEQPWGQHIALTCRNHPDLRWNTKNIGHIGARTIFFNGFATGQSECPCSIRELVVLKGNDNE